MVGLLPFPRYLAIWWHGRPNRHPLTMHLHFLCHTKCQKSQSRRCAAPFRHRQIKHTANSVKYQLGAGFAPRARGHIPKSGCAPFLVCIWHVEGVSSAKNTCPGHNSNFVLHNDGQNAKNPKMVIMERRFDTDGSTTLPIV